MTAGYVEKAWTPRRKAKFAEKVEEQITLPHPRTATFCSHCSNDIGPIVYSASVGGVVRWPYLCADCAASWVNLGGRVVVRWAREHFPGGC